MLQPLSLRLNCLKLKQLSISFKTKDPTFRIRTYFKTTETFQYTHFSSCYAPDAKKEFIKGKATNQLLKEDP